MDVQPNVYRKTSTDCAMTEPSKDGVGACARQFAEVAAESEEPIDSRRFGAIRSAWQRYYTGPFAELDRQIRAESVRRGGPVFVSLSVTHHNLQRLIEVLGLDLEDDMPLSAAPIPERVMDLRFAIERVRSVFDSLGSVPAPSIRGAHYVDA